MSIQQDQEIILVVDDSPDSIGMINTALAAEGFTVLVALDGNQAITIAEQITPHVILMDAIMPHMDGFECCQQLREFLPLTPILFMTGLTETESLVKAFDCGGTDYLTKPIDPIEMIARIKRHTQTARYLKEAQEALDVAHQYVFAVNNNGEIQWATPAARNELIAFENKNDLSESICQWLKNPEALEYPLKNNELSIDLRYVQQSSDNEHLIRLIRKTLGDAEILENELPLTKREAEVLLWLSYGKSNKEIAEILSMSPRTVNKHLEQIFPKIGAENRTVASSIAIRQLVKFE